MKPDFFIFPRIGRFNLEPRVARSLGMDPELKPTAWGLRWFNWQLAVADVPDTANYDPHLAAGFRAAVEEANRPKVEPEVANKPKAKRKVKK